MEKSMNWYKNIKMSQQKEKQLWVVRGPSGSGKSSLVKELIKEGGYVFSTDDYWKQNTEKKYIFDASKLGMAHEWNRQRAKRAMEEGLTPIIIDNTNITKKEIFPYLEMGKKYGYKMEIKEPDWGTIKNQDGTWNLETLLKNQQNKDRDKSVPKESIKRMIDRYEYDLTPERIFGEDNKNELV